MKNTTRARHLKKYLQLLYKMLDTSSEMYIIKVMVIRNHPRSIGTGRYAERVQMGETSTNQSFSE